MAEYIFEEIKNKNMVHDSIELSSHSVPYLTENEQFSDIKPWDIP